MNATFRTVKLPLFICQFVTHGAYVLACVYAFMCIYTYIFEFFGSVVCAHNLEYELLLISCFCVCTWKDVYLLTRACAAFLYGSRQRRKFGQEKISLRQCIVEKMNFAGITVKGDYELNSVNYFWLFEVHFPWACGQNIFAFGFIRAPGLNPSGVSHFRISITILFLAK